MSRSIWWNADGWPISETLIRNLQASQLAAASRGRLVLEGGSFTVLLNQSSEFPWFNYAVPTREDFSDPALASMEGAFREHGRRPRIEYFESLWPSLAARLVQRGWRLQGRLPVMLVTAETFRPVDLADYDVRLLKASDDLRSYLAVGNSAFGEGPVGDEERAQQHRLQIEAGTLRCALARIQGVPAAVACTMPESGVAELAGVGTKPEFRRRGLASAVSSLLIEDALQEEGAIVWLSAGDDAARAVYERLGFQAVGWQCSYMAD